MRSLHIGNAVQILPDYLQVGSQVKTIAIKQLPKFYFSPREHSLTRILNMNMMETFMRNKATS